MDEKVYERDMKLQLRPLGMGGCAILVWEFHEAPEALREFSQCGGDEDGICWVPDGVQRPWWLEKMWNQYGEPDEIKFEDGVLVIWAHS